MTRRTPLEIAIDGDQAEAGRKARYEARRRAGGDVRVAVWVPRDRVEALKAYAGRLRAGHGEASAMDDQAGVSEPTVAGPEPVRTDAPPPVRRPERGKHPKPDELAFMRWHFDRFSAMDAAERIQASTGRATSMIFKWRKRWQAGEM